MLDQPAERKVVQVGIAIKLSDSPARIERSPLCEHHDEVF